MKEIYDGTMVDDDTPCRGEGGKLYPLTAEETAENQVLIDAHNVDAPRREITRLEGEINIRRIREATLTASGKAWMQNQDDLIAIQRGKLLKLII